MRNSRDEKYDDQDEGEYHFSDEDANYQADADAPKSAPVSPSTGNMLNRLTRSKRMLISAGVFIVLMFVVFKMVSPSTQTIPTEIVPAPVVANAPVAAPAPMQAPAVAPVVAEAPPAMIAPATPVAAPQPAMTQPAMTQPAETAASVPPSTPTTNPSAAAIQQAAVPSLGEATQQLQAMQQQMAQSPPATGAPAPSQPPVSMPNLSQSGMLPSASAIDAQVAAVSAQNEKRALELQADYAQKVTSFETQNKAIQDQVQILNSRIALMESQMNQLVQMLTRQSQGGAAPAATMPGMPTTPAPAAQTQEVNPVVKTSYNVQAIIPGRAWLRSDAGEAITVAEGDVVKDLGRVTKIDPYDGVVEINTGTKVVSLSYGNVG